MATSRDNRRSVQGRNNLKTASEGRLTIGNISRHIDKDSAVWLADNVPEGMTLAEFFMVAVLPDLMAEGDQ